MLSAVRDSVIPRADGPALDVGDLYQAHGASVSQWIAHLAGPDLEVEDLLQEVFLVVQRRLSEFRPGTAKVTTWLYRITERVVNNARRRLRFRRWVSRVRQRELADCLVQPTLTPAAQLDRADERRLVYRALDRLPTRYRTALVLFELEGMSGEEVALLTNVKLPTVWVQIHRGRALFLAALAELGVSSHAA